jgi:acyltransferase
LFSSHGHILLFPLTALAGSALILLIAGMTRPQKTIVWLGQNTLLLMCLNGIFYHYINPPAAKWVLANLPDSSLIVLGVSLAVTAASLVLCMPCIWWFNRFVPQLVGKPKSKGVLIKQLHLKWLPNTAYIGFLVLPLVSLVDLSFISTPGALFFWGGSTPF